MSRRSKRKTTASQTDASKRRKHQNDLKELERSTTETLGEDFKKLKWAIREGSADCLGEEFSTQIIKTIFEFQKHSKVCAFAECPKLYGAIHMHEESKWIETDEKPRHWGKRQKTDPVYRTRIEKGRSKSRSANMLAYLKSTDFFSSKLFNTSGGKGEAPICANAKVNDGETQEAASR